MEICQENNYVKVVIPHTPLAAHPPFFALYAQNIFITPL